MTKNTTLKVDSAVYDHEVHQTEAKGVLKIGGGIKLIQKPGDMTVNYLLAFFALFSSPIISIVVASEYYQELNLFLQIVCVFSLLLLMFMLILKTSPGIKMIQYTVNYIKSTEIK